MNSLGFYLSELIKKIYKLSKVKPDFNEPIVIYPKTTFSNKYLAFLQGLFTTKVNIETSERIVENPFLFKNLTLKKGSKILEVGCCRSRIAVELASLGYKVTGNDLKYYQFTHPNFTFIQGDLRYLDLPQKSFDMVTSISTIEHTGLGAYKEKKGENGDKEMVNKIYNLLKPGGKFIVTLPYGKSGENSNERVYDNKRLNKLLSKFSVKKTEYYKGIERKYWIPVKEQEMTNVDSIHKRFTQGVACIIAQKPKN